MHRTHPHAEAQMPGIAQCALEHGQFVWPSADTTGRIMLTSAQLVALLEPLGQHAQPDPVMPDQFDQSGASSTEGKHCPVEWIIF